MYVNCTSKYIYADVFHQNIIIQTICNMHKKEEKGGQQASVKGYFVILRPVYCLASVNIFLCYILWLSGHSNVRHLISLKHFI